MTLIRHVKGFCNRTGLKKVPILVQFTSDNLGETLSITSERENIQLTVKYSDIEKIVARERENGYKDGHLIIDEGWGEDA